MDSIVIAKLSFFCIGFFLGSIIGRSRSFSLEKQISHQVYLGKEVSILVNGRGTQYTLEDGKMKKSAIEIVETKDEGDTNA